MNYDVFTINAVVDELKALVVGGRVQDVIDVSETAIGLEIYANRRRHYLLLDADPQRPRVHLVEGKLRRGIPHPTQLGLLMRRYVEGAFLADVSQPPWERMITLHMDGVEGISDVIVETIERRANILLVQEGLILECIRRVGPDENRVRVSLPGHDYVPPPPQRGKRPPNAVTVEDIGTFLDSDPGARAWQMLTRHVLGVSPVLAREIVFRATGGANTKAADTSPRAVYRVFGLLLLPLLRHEWQPGIMRGDDGQVTAFAVYPITYLPGWEAMETVSAALAAYYGAPVGMDAYAQAKAPVAAQLREAIARVQHKVNALQEAMKSEDELARLRQSGELLLAYQYTIEPGAETFAAQYDPDQPPLEITLDPSLSPLENAKRYFARYEKARRAIADVPKRLKAAQNELAFLRQLETDLAMATNWPEIDEVREALEREGYWRGPRQSRPKSGKSAPLKVTTSDGFVIWIGRNSRQNDLVTFSKGSPDDLWLHARGVPGSHVIVKSGGREVPEAIIRRAAELAAFFSAAREDSRVLVDVTRRKYVRKIRGGKPGMVMYRNEEPIEVQPRGPDED